MSETNRTDQILVLFLLNERRINSLLCEPLYLFVSRTSDGPKIKRQKDERGLIPCCISPGGDGPCTLLTQDLGGD